MGQQQKGKWGAWLAWALKWGGLLVLSAPMIVALYFTWSASRFWGVVVTSGFAANFAFLVASEYRTYVREFGRERLRAIAVLEDETKEAVRKHVLKVVGEEIQKLKEAKKEKP